MDESAGPERARSNCIIIPARFASTRFPGKPLARLKGTGSVERSLIEWSWRAASNVPRVDRVLVATDDLRIAEEVKRFGGEVIMTPAECANGTERCAAAIAEMADAPQVVVNFQGDAPLTPADIVTALLDRMASEPDLSVATPAVRCTPDTYAHLSKDRAAGRVGGTTVVFDRRQRALYFSKNVIPYVSDMSAGAAGLVHLHLGVYAYRPEALAAYVAAPPSALELSEGLEQLRFLDLGIAVGTVVRDPPEGLMIELNNPTDAALVEGELRRRNL